MDCWIGQYRPGNSKLTYYQLRTRKPFSNGKCTRHLSGQEVGAFKRLVENGRALKKIEKALSKLEKQKLDSRSVLTSSASDEHYTPPEFIELARSVMGGIDLDPASNAKAQSWIKARQYYTMEDNGLLQTWMGRLWLNPPYGKQTHLWTGKAIREFESGHISQAIILVRPAVGSSWYVELSKRFARCETHKRIRFLDSNGKEQGSPVHGNVFFYLGDKIEDFKKAFGSIGVVTQPI